MKLTFYGAAGEVTGSCSELDTGSEKILVDCGLFQGGEEHDKKNYSPLPFDAKAFTGVIVTHAHLDHVGRLPLLVKNGFDGFIYATPPTKELTKLVLEDTFGVMEFENRKNGKPLLYKLGDIEEVMGRFKTVDYHESFTIGKSKCEFYDAGHIFGSAFVEVNTSGKKIVFSGDVGNVDVPILRDTEKLPDKLDVLICESTYGDRLHEPTSERESVLKGIIAKTVQENGVLMIPSFALERTQEILYALNDIIDRHHTLKVMPIYLDSPLAIDALKVYEKYPKYYDEEAKRFFDEGDDVFDFQGLQKTYLRDDSMKINKTQGSKVIIAGAGMMNGGRILHHAIRYLSDHKNTLLFVGFQSQGTLGWRILNGADRVEIHNEKVSVRCQIKMINSFSAHGDREKLLSWVGNKGKVPKKIFLNHGEPNSSEALKIFLHGKGIEAEQAAFNKPVEI